MSDPFIAWLQGRLTDHGLAPGNVDGIFGNVTRKALIEFQTREKLPITGTANEATVQFLKTEPKVTGVDRNYKSDTPKNKTQWPTQTNAANFFGKPGTRQTQIEVPYDMYLSWDKDTRLRKMTVHELVAPSVVRVLNRVSNIYSREERKSIGLDLFGGSLNVRPMRGGSKPSMHSYGIAIDFDPERNQLRWGRDRARLAKPDAIEFWLEWEKEGWRSLGRTDNFDWMHVQATR
jgi:hypothetical protein